MNIKYNKIEKSIEIKDALYNHYLILKSVMILNLISSVLQLLDVDKVQIGFKEILLSIVAIISLVALYVFFFKRTTLNKIPIENII